MKSMYIVLTTRWSIC